MYNDATLRTRGLGKPTIQTTLSCGFKAISFLDHVRCLVSQSLQLYLFCITIHIKAKYYFHIIMNWQLSWTMKPCNDC
jgi:hypothetical protein